MNDPISAVACYWHGFIHNGAMQIRDDIVGSDGGGVLTNAHLDDVLLAASPTELEEASHEVAKKYDELLLDDLGINADGSEF